MTPAAPLAHGAGRGVSARLRPRPRPWPGGRTAWRPTSRSLRFSRCPAASRWEGSRGQALGLAFCPKTLTLTLTQMGEKGKEVKRGKAQSEFRPSREQFACLTAAGGRKRGGPKGAPGWVQRSPLHTWRVPGGCGRERVPQLLVWDCAATGLAGNHTSCTGGGGVLGAAWPGTSCSGERTERQLFCSIMCCLLRSGCLRPAWQGAV
jgi:hypothetical protein